MTYSTLRALIGGIVVAVALAGCVVVDAPDGGHAGPVHGPAPPVSGPPGAYRIRG